MEAIEVSQPNRAKDEYRQEPHHADAAAKTLPIMDPESEFVPHLSLAPRGLGGFVSSFSRFCIITTLSVRSMTISRADRNVRLLSASKQSSKCLFKIAAASFSGRRSPICRQGHGNICLEKAAVDYNVSKGSFVISQLYRYHPDVVFSLYD